MSEPAPTIIEQLDQASSAAGQIRSRVRHVTRGDACLPTLFDRLTGDIGVPRDGRVQISRAAYQETVLRDLRWLLNCVSTVTADELQVHTHLRNSVLNYGIPAFAGGCLTASDLQAVAHRIECAIRDFEPRILPDSLAVTLVPDTRAATGNHFVYRIKAAIWFEPYPIDLSLRARWETDGGLIDLEGE